MAGSHPTYHVNVIKLKFTPEFIAMLKIHFIGLFQGHGLCDYYVSCKTFRTVMSYVPLAVSHCKSERSVLALKMGPFR